MAGSDKSGQDMESGRTNRADDRTVIWAQVQPDQGNFNGPAILIVDVAKDPEDEDDYDDGQSFQPSNAIDGVVATGWSGGSASNFGGTPGGGVGVVGKGGGTRGPASSGSAAGPRSRAAATAAAAGSGSTASAARSRASSPTRA